MSARRLESRESDELTSVSAQRGARNGESGGQIQLREALVQIAFRFSG